MDPSSELRRRGDALRASGDLLAAVAAYTEAVAAAPRDSCARALALAARSALLAAAGRPGDAVLDSERALGVGACPPPLRLRLHLRAAGCLRVQQRPAEAAAHFAAAVELIARCEAPEEQRREMLALAERNLGRGVRPTAFEVEQRPPPGLSHGAHPQLPGFSAAVRLESDELYGRKVIADRDLQAGDVILVEEPAVSNLKGDARWLHCSHCYKPCLSLMPCEECKMALYCSGECQAAAWVGPHRSACPALLRFRELGVSLGLSESSFANLTRVVDFVAAFGAEALRAHDDSDTESLLGRLLGLCWHQSEHQGRIQAACAQVLKRCFDLEEQRLSQLACRMLLIHQANSYSIEQAVVRPGGGLEIRHVAYATYPSASLLNHSCDPNVVASYHQRKMVVRAIRPIRQGEQLFNRYCNSFYNMPKDMRHVRLSSYNFDCGCVACALEWPVVKLLPDDPPFTEGAELVERVRAALAAAGRSSGGLDWRCLAEPELFQVCVELQRKYFDTPCDLSRLDKIYRSVELLLYYHFGASTVTVVDKGEQAGSLPGVQLGAGDKAWVDLSEPQEKFTTDTYEKRYVGKDTVPDF